MSQVVQKLSATKQKLSLGEVKKAEKANAASARKFTRTTVVNPDDFEWPFITEEDEKELLECLASDLQPLKLPNYFVPLDVISKVEKGDRRNYRHIWHTQRALEVGFDVAVYTKLRADISIGANCVSTAMQQDVLNAVIIDKNVDPPIITKLLVPIARSKGIPIVAINGLSKACQNAFKTRCIAMGFKAGCRDFSHPFNRICRMISDISAKENQVSEAAAALFHSNQTGEAPSTTTIAEVKQQSNPGSSTINEKTSERKTEPKRSASANFTQSFKPPKIRKV